MTYEVVKHNKRLWIGEIETGKLIYTPTEWVRSRLQSRQPMIELARAMTEKRYDIGLIIEFESRHNPRLRSEASSQGNQDSRVVPPGNDDV